MAQNSAQSSGKEKDRFRAGARCSAWTQALNLAAPQLLGAHSGVREISSTHSWKTDVVQMFRVLQRYLDLNRVMDFGVGRSHSLEVYPGGLRCSQCFEILFLDETY